MNKKLLFGAGGAAVIVILAVLFNSFWGDNKEQEDAVLEPEIEVVEEVAGEQGTGDEKIILPSPSPSAKPIDDDQFVAFLHLAREQFNNGQLSESNVSYHNAIENGSNEPLLVANAWFELYYVLIALDDIDGARAALDTAIEMDPDNSTFLSAKELFDKRENQN